MKKENQIIFIRWWEAFNSEELFYEYVKNKEYNPYKIKKSWRDWIWWALSENFEVFEPQMPCKQYAKYKAWKIWFEKLFPYLKDNKIILVWRSLWWIFLTKYLSENKFPKEITQLHLVAPIFNEEWLVWEQLDDFKLNEKLLENVEKQSKNIFFYFSTDDPILPFKQHYNYKKYFKNSEFLIFENRWHFSQPALPELLENINKGLKICLKKGKNY